MDAAEVRARAADPLSFSAGLDQFVAVDAVKEAIARWAAPLPRSRQPDDVARRAAVACSCALSELALRAPAATGWSAAERGVAEDAATLAELAGLASARVAPALALLAAAGCIERVAAARGERRVVFAAGIQRDDPTLARVAWSTVRARLRAVRASVLPAQAVLRVVARHGGPVADRARAPVVAVTQETLASEALLGRTAVVSALRALVDAGLVDRAARRGTWTECRLLAPVFDADAALDGVGGLEPLPGPMRGDREVPLGRGEDHGRAGPRAAATVDRPSPPRVAASGATTPRDAEMALDVGGVRVPLAPGMTVQPPAGATITIELDDAGRRYLCLGPGLRLGPLP